ncbi:MAG TPA: hypothetical protein VKZ57_07950 [Sphingobacterium sp.]|nr:hypothetical protein [Sphingobacterium sp.]
MKRLSFSIALGIVGLFFLPTSCDHQAIDELEVQPYLFLERGGGLSLQDQQMLRKAFVRAGIRFQDGKFRFKAQSGNELNMSEQLFEMLKGIVDNSNNRRLSMSFKGNPPRLKSGAEIPTSPADTTASDCVAHSISAVLAGFGKSVSSTDIDTWIQSEYGTNGVPGNAFYDVLDNYVVGESCEVPSSFSYSNTGPFIVLAIDLNGGGHSVTLMEVSGHSIMYRDDQNDGGTGICHIDDVRYAYQASSAL